MSIPDYQTLMLPVLHSAAQSERKVIDLVEPIADELGLTSEEREAMLPSGRQRVLHNRIHWAKFYMTKAGLLSSTGRGRFIATDKGRAILASNPERIDVNVLLREPEFREFYRNEASDAEESPSLHGNELATTRAVTPEEQIEDAYRALQAALRTELLDRIAGNDPAFFEQVIIELLVSMGYGGSHKSAATQLGRSGDGGVDGVINEDRLGLDRVYVQAKRYAAGHAVGRPDVQSFVGSLVGLGATKGVFVTTSAFTSQAIEFVRHLSQRVILIDGKQLADLMIEHDVGVRTSRELSFKRVDEDFFSGD
jgi:restriction system protein